MSTSYLQAKFREQPSFKTFVDMDITLYQGGKVSHIRARVCPDSLSLSSCGRTCGPQLSLQAGGPSLPAGYGPGGLGLQSEQLACTSQVLQRTHRHWPAGVCGRYLPCIHICKVSSNCEVYNGKYDCGKGQATQPHLIDN